MGLVGRLFTFVNGVGNKIDADQVNAELNQIITLVGGSGNGNLESVNLKPSANILGSQLAAGTLGKREIGALPSARAYQAIASVISNNVAPVPLLLSSERFDSDSIHGNAVNATRLTCKTAGLYLIGAQVQWQQVFVSTGMRKTAILLNGTTTLALDQVPPVNADVTIQSVQTLTRLAVNDYVEVVVSQISGGVLNVEYNSQSSPEFWMTWIGA